MSINPHYIIEELQKLDRHLVYAVKDDRSIEIKMQTFDCSFFLSYFWFNAVDVKVQLPSQSEKKHICSVATDKEVVDEITKFLIEKRFVRLEEPTALRFLVNEIVQDIRSITGSEPSYISFTTESVVEESEESGEWNIARKTFTAYVEVIVWRSLLKITVHSDQKIDLDLDISHGLPRFEETKLHRCATRKEFAKKLADVLDWVKQAKEQAFQ